MVRRVAKMAANLAALIRSRNCFKEPNVKTIYASHYQLTKTAMLCTFS